MSYTAYRAAIAGIGADRPIDFSSELTAQSPGDELLRCKLTWYERALACNLRYPMLYRENVADDHFSGWSILLTSGGIHSLP